MILKKTLPYFFVLLLITIYCSCEDTAEDTNDDISKYLGTWNVSDQSARINYTVTIIANPSNSAEVLMSNFADLGNPAIVLVAGDLLVIDTQLIDQDYTVSGSGNYITEDKLIINFDINDGIDTESRIATFTR